MERQLLEDIFVTALEGGSNYWYHITAETNQKIRKAVPKYEDPYFATAMLTAILDHGLSVEINDADNEDEVLGVLSYDSMKERLEDIDKHLDYRWALVAHQDEIGDAESADIVFQYLVMGDVWFS
jgi:tetrahydromethanopterin S-methyltransferase subunit G